MWPIGSDYADAFQNPRVSFRDPELRAATAELRNRTPNVITGSYAAVCRMTDVSSRSWAVRCFLRDIPDQQERYAAIDAALRALASPATVGFEYQPEGILVNGRRFPILKMEWVAGESLIPYVQARLGQSSLRQLADKLEALVKQLSAAGIAHGDLQFGNVILQGDAPRLIDYDGLYVPALAGRGSHERGHANFQHPNRTGTDFGPTTDHFSVWSIAVALHALSHDASLWGRHEGGDDRLLFCKADYADPETSALFAELATAGNPQVRELTRRFRSHLTTGRVEFPAFLSRPAWVDAEQDSQPPQPPTPNTPEPSNTGRASHIATALRYLAEWDVTVDAWKVSQNHLNIALTNARTEGFSNSRNFESAAWAVAYGALSPTPLCLVVGLWWMVLPCVAAILSCRVALAYRCYATDSALDSTGRPVSVIPQCYLQIINTRRDATFARQDFDESAKQFVDEYLRLEACVKVMVETRRDLKYEPVEARRQLADARARHLAATEDQRRLTASGVTNRPALALCIARNTEALTAFEGAKRQFDTLDVERRRFELLADQDQVRIDELRSSSDVLALIAKRYLEAFEKAGLHALHLPARPQRELEAGLMRLNRDRTSAMSEFDREAQTLRERKDRLDAQFASDCKKITALTLEDSVAARKIRVLTKQLHKKIEVAAAEKIAINAAYDKVITGIDSEVKRLNKQCKIRAENGQRELAQAVTTTRALHETAQRNATKAIGELTRAERDPQYIQSSGRAKNAAALSNAAQSKVNIADMAFQAVVTDLATARSVVAQLDRDTEAASTALDAVVAALVVAERDALVATDVTTSFDSAARELAAFRNSGVAELDAASQKCQERSDAVEREHVELTAAAKLSVTSLSFRDYLRFGLTP